MHKKMFPLHVFEARSWLDDDSMHYLGQALASPGEIRPGDAYALLFSCDVGKGVMMHPCINFLRREWDGSWDLNPEEIISTDTYLRAPLALAATALHTDGHLSRMLINLLAQANDTLATGVTLLVTSEFACVHSRKINPQSLAAGSTATYDVFLCAIVPPTSGQSHARLKNFQVLTQSLPMLEALFRDENSGFRLGDGLKLADMPRARKSA